MVDNKVQHHINIENKWPRCREVKLRDGVLHCTLDLERCYSLTEAYKYDPHIQFANAKTDQELSAFMSAWGPLFLNPDTPRVMHLDVEACRALQRWYRALFDLLAAFREADEEKEALRGFANAEYKLLPFEGLESNSLLALRNKFQIAGSILDWIETANLHSIRVAMDCMIENLPVGPLGTHLVCRRERTERRIEAGWTIPDLQCALRWMVFQDEFTRYPIICCKECRTVFRATSAHVRKYCPDSRCAHRATARVWQQNKRKAARRAEHDSNKRSK